MSGSPEVPRWLAHAQNGPIWMAAGVTELDLAAVPNGGSARVSTPELDNAPCRCPRSRERRPSKRGWQVDGGAGGSRRQGSGDAGLDERRQEGDERGGVGELVVVQFLVLEHDACRVTERPAIEDEVDDGIGPVTVRRCPVDHQQPADGEIEPEFLADFTGTRGMGWLG